MSEELNQADGSVKDRVAAVVDKLRPLIQGDGGDLELVDVTAEGVVQVRLHGACVGCPGAQMTLRMGVERNIKASVPEIREVVCVNPG
ncbi:MAG TPA: NifU family protein [Phycisphaerae bacterium]|nr:NifU family protein [Phycisphaerae bacterium]